MVIYLNLIKHNEVLSPLLNKTKIFYEENILEITHYSKILIINNTEISLRNIIVLGTDLKVIYIDKYLIRISGNIEVVKRGIKK